MLRLRTISSRPTPLVWGGRIKRVANIRKLSNQAQPRVGLARRAVKPVFLTFALGGTVYAVDKYQYSSLMTRSIRAIYYLSWVAYEYSTNMKKYKNVNDLHEIVAESLYYLLKQNKGMYIKLGQAIANQGSIFPIAFQKRFVKLYDDAPEDDWNVIDRMLQKSLGPHYETEIFESVDHKPVASASIAQVHKAVLKNGKEVAIKVQHHYVSQQIVVDLWVYRLISKMYDRLFDLPLSSFTRYISDQLLRETDFIHEMHNSENFGRIIEHDKALQKLNVAVPQSYPDLTHKQVLVSEWIDGISLTDKERLLDNGFDLAYLMRQYLGMLGKQIFKYGSIHSDPHPGNVIARYDSRGKQQMVLIDHGLYIELPKNIMNDYAMLWRYLFSFNAEGIKSIAKKWGVNSVDVFVTVIQLKPQKSFSPKLRSSDSRTFPELFKELFGDKEKFPAELFFLSRTMRMMQTLNKNFGGPVNRVNLLTNESIDALLGSRNGVYEMFGLLQIKLMLFFSGLIFRFVRLRQILYGDRYGGKGKGLEDYIEMYMQNTAKSIGVDYVQLDA